MTGVFTQGLHAYSKTDGVLILTPVKRMYNVRTAAECAAKCDAETTFTCRYNKDHTGVLWFFMLSKLDSLD